MKRTCYYDLLGVAKDASRETIRRAWSKLAKYHHPDVAKFKQLSYVFMQDINEAYGVLGDQDKRKKYDRFGHDFERARKAPPAPPKPEPESSKPWHLWEAVVMRPKPMPRERKIRENLPEWANSLWFAKVTMRNNRTKKVCEIKFPDPHDFDIDWGLKIYVRYDEKNNCCYIVRKESNNKKRVRYAS